MVVLPYVRIYRLYYNQDSSASNLVDFQIFLFSKKVCYCIYNYWNTSWSWWYWYNTIGTYLNLLGSVRLSRRLISFEPRFEHIFTYSHTGRNLVPTVFTCAASLADSHIHSHSVCCFSMFAVTFCFLSLKQDGTFIYFIECFFVFDIQSLEVTS